MTSYSIVSARIPKELKKEIEKLGIKPSEVIRRALWAEVKRRKLEIIKKRKKKLRRVLNMIPEERVVETVRETREIN